MAEIQSVNDDSFQNEVLDSDVPVVVDFWAEWCGPCKMIVPILEQVAQEFNARVKFYKMNVDENEKTPPKYGIRSIPTLLIFKDGDEAGRVMGAISKQELTAFIETNS